MNITVRTAGLLGRYLPPGSAGNEARIEVDSGSTPLDIMRRLELPEHDSYLVMLNGQVVPAATRPSIELSDGDDLGIFPPLKGG
ncbi:MAG TPA: MoaD/ThiS family protein [Aestuariivirgaceae bacterium]|nr:MoaD/ThiS family protein [Aestuariivirgaceae bacterium]